LPERREARALVRTRHEPHGVITYRSRMLSAAGFSHAFAARHGGVSEGPFATLNLGIAIAPWVEDPLERVEENLRRLLEAAGLAGGRLVRVTQVHGVETLVAERIADGPRCEADALVAAAPGFAIAIRMADCVPVLLACPRTGHVAAVHAGWRGLVGGTIESAVAALERGGVVRGELVAAIGPCIGVAAYEVGPEVAATCRAAGLEAAVSTAWPREHLDCFRAAAIRLEAAGVDAARIDGEPLCTFAHPDEFFSYRRDGARSGRLAAVIGPR
jgi:YfiH family protein